jgi:hypothetical protein
VVEVAALQQLPTYLLVCPWTSSQSVCGFGSGSAAMEASQR